MKNSLGKGLGELFSLYEDDDKSIEKTISKGDGTPIEIDIDLIEPNPNQPRKAFNEDSLSELAKSIKIHGVIQPIIVNITNNEKYIIIAGERRWRASKLANKKTIPCIIKNYSDKQISEISIIENLQREDLNPIEAAKAIKKLMEEYSFSQEEVADRIGKSRPSIANTLRLLTLYPEIITMVEKGELSSGHARSLVVIDDVSVQLKFANQAKNNKLSVRELEKMVKNYLNPKMKEKPNQSSELKNFVDTLSKVFATKVSVLGNDNKGRIYIDYYSRDDIDRIYELIEILQSKVLTLKDFASFNKINNKPKK